MKTFLIFAALLALALSESYMDFRAEWQEWKATHGKKYNSDDEDMNRFEVWVSNLDYVNKWNAEEHSFTLGMNEYSDMTEDEFRTAFFGLKSSAKAKGCEMAFNATDSVSAVPDSVDWRTEGYVTEVKNQGNCGSCWAFSTTGSLEGQHFKKTNKLVSLSEQNLVDCSKKEGNDGCEGGLMEQGFEYIKVNGGIDTEESYPYKAKDGHCHYKQAESGATCSGCVKVKAKSEEQLQQAVASVGPISIAMDAHLRSFMMYKQGIYFDKKCSSTKLDHGVLAVGYGTQGADDYWIVKNSWGKSWGMKGFFMIARNKDNACGIATDASYPVV